MTRGRPAHRAARRTGWMGSAKKRPRGRGMPLWQWILAVPVIALMLGGIGLFAYLAMFAPKSAAGFRTVTVLVLERVENHLAGGGLDTTGSYLVVSVEGTRFKLAPRLPDWNRIAKGDLIEVDVTGAGPTLGIVGWRASGTGAAPTPPTGSSGAAPSAPGSEPPPRR